VSESRAALIALCVPVKLMSRTPVHVVYPKPKVSPVVIEMEKVVPDGLDAVKATLASSVAPAA
jgi:hypothetical protein